MNDVEGLAYFVARLLRLYPIPFRAEFSDEMMDVVMANLGAAAARGRLALALMFMREVCGLLHGAIHEHRRVLVTKGYGDCDRARRTRRWGQIIAAASGVWWLFVLLVNETLRAEFGPLLGCAILLALMGAILAPWRRKLSSAIVLTSGVLIVATLASEALLLGGTFHIAIAVIGAMPLLAAGGLILDAPALAGHQSGGLLTTILGSAALALSWWGLVIVLGVLTERWLVPWDTWAEPVRPPAGDWQRAINDFFESGFGAFVPALVLISAGAFVFLTRLRSGYSVTYLTWFVAAANLLVSIAGIIALPVVDIQHPSTPEEIGYRYTWPGILMLLLSCAALLSLARPRRPSAKAMLPHQR